MVIDAVFNGYLRWVKHSDKLKYLQKCLSDAVNEDDVDAARVLICLIALENNNLRDERDLNVYAGFQVTKSDNPIWLLVRGMLNLELGNADFNLKRCNKAKNLIQKSLDNSYIKKPIYIEYYLARAYYKIGKISLKSEDNFKKAKEHLEKILKNEEETENIVVVLNMMGDLSLKLRERPSALQWYTKAKDLSPEFPYPYIGLGNYYREHNQYEDAIDYYSQAIQKDKDLMYPWNYLGDCFRLLEEYSIAIKCYSRAIEVSNDNSIIFPLYGLGRVYYDLGNKNDFSRKYYNKANEYFKKVIERCNYSRISQTKYTKRDMAKIQEKFGDFNGANEIYKEVLKSFKNNEFRTEEIGNAINRNRQRIAIEKFCESFGQNNCNSSENNNPFSYVMCQTVKCGLEKRSILMKDSFEKDFLEEKFKLAKYLTKFVKKHDNGTVDSLSLKPLIDAIKDTRINYDNIQLHILRKWNSYTPIINNSKGGGYFLKVNDLGIVIDPGFNFIKNFKEANYRFSDIDIILVSHSHDDHTADLESIFNLQNRYNKRLKETILPREIAKEESLSTVTILNSEKYSKKIEERFKSRKKELKLYITKGVSLKFCGQIKKSKGFFRNNKFRAEEFKDPKFEPSIYVNVIKAGDEFPIKDNNIKDSNIKVKVIAANHSDLITNQSCVGFVIELEKVVIVYTGDTGWYKNEKESLESQYLQIKNDYKGEKSIVLIAHLGGFKESEDNFWRYDEDSKSVCLRDLMDTNCDSKNKMFYKTHLGRLGLVKLVDVLEPDMCLISEFGEEFNGLRIKFASIMQEAFKHKKISFLPADIGLSIDLSDAKALKVKSISNIDFKNHKLIFENETPDKIKVGEFRDENALFYYHGNSIVEGDCIQAFIEDFLEDNELYLLP